MPKVNVTAENLGKPGHKNQLPNITMTNELINILDGLTYFDRPLYEEAKSIMRERECVMFGGDKERFMVEVRKEFEDVWKESINQRLISVEQNLESLINLNQRLISVEQKLESLINEREVVQSLINEINVLKVRLMELTHHFI